MMRHTDDYPKHPDRPTVAVHFDGVLNAYTGWAGDNELFDAAEGVGDFLESITDQGYRIVVVTTRSPERVRGWLDAHGLSQWVANVTNQRPRAVAYIDARAVHHGGDFDATLWALEGLAIHWKEEQVEDDDGDGETE